MGTIDLPDPEIFQPDPATLLTLDPIVSADPEADPSQLPRSGSACRYCGVRAAADATLVGGTFRIPIDAVPPADATSVRRVNLGMDAILHERAMAAKEAGDMTAYGRARAGRKVQEVTTPTWRVCSACEALDRNPEPMAVLFASLGTIGRFPRTPTTIYLAERRQVQPYHATGGQPTDRGSRTPWAHAATETAAAAELLAELESAGGAPAPTGLGCGICGRTHSPYGWRETTWRPPGTALGTFRVALCDGYRVQPGRIMRGTPPLRRRVGCGLLVEMPGQAGSLADRIRTAALRDGAAAPHPFTVLPDDMDRFMAWTHPDFRRSAGTPAKLAPRPAWWHLADVPLAPPSAEDRLAELEKRLVEAPA